MVFLQLNKEETQKYGRKKLLKMHKVLPPRNRFDISRKEEERGLGNTKDCVNRAIKAIEEYSKKNKERLILAAGNRTNNWNSNIHKKI